MPVTNFTFSSIVKTVNSLIKLSVLISKTKRNRLFSMTGFYKGISPYISTLFVLTNSMHLKKHCFRPPASHPPRKWAGIFPKSPTWLSPTSIFSTVFSKSHWTAGHLIRRLMNWLALPNRLGNRSKENPWHLHPYLLLLQDPWPLREQASPSPVGVVLTSSRQTKRRRKPKDFWRIL